MYAARAWWLLRWMGHADVAVLDGGIDAWRAAGGTLTTDAPAPHAAAPYPLLPPALPTIDADALQARLGRVQLIDARGGDRFRGEVEPLDRAAGHIPGARNRPFRDNLEADGRFKSVAALHAASTDVTRATLCCVLMQFREGQVTLVTADGFEVLTLGAAERAAA